MGCSIFLLAAYVRPSSLFQVQPLVRLSTASISTERRRGKVCDAYKRYKRRVISHNPSIYRRYLYLNTCCGITGTRQNPVRCYLCRYCIHSAALAIGLSFGLARMKSEAPCPHDSWSHHILHILSTCENSDILQPSSQPARLSVHGTPIIVAVHSTASSLRGALGH
jgi:hypothetical protein